MLSISLTLSAALFIIILSSRIALYYANGEPLIITSPTCGPGEPGFNIKIDANGFSPNSNVDWKLVNSEGFVPVYGYYQTNSTRNCPSDRTQ